MYIGSSCDLNKRYYTHVGLLRKDRHSNKHLQRSWNKYGEYNFKFSVIEYVDNNNDLIIREQYWMDELQAFHPSTGYNIRKIASSNLGLIFSKEARIRMSISQTGRKHSIETLRKLSLCKRKENLSQSTLDKYSLANRGENGHNTKLTDNDVISIKQMLIHKESRGKLAILFDVSRQLIDQIAEGKIWTHVIVKDFIPNTIQKKLKLEDAVNIKKLLMQGMAQKDIMNIYNISDTLISDINNERKWKSAYVEGFKTIKNKGTRKLNYTKAQEIRELLKQGKTQNELADMYDISTKTVSGIKTGVIWKEKICVI